MACFQCGGTGSIPGQGTNNPQGMQCNQKVFVFLNCMCCAQTLQSCLTLCDPMDHGPPGSSVHGTLQARILKWVVMPSSFGLYIYTHTHIYIHTIQNQMIEVFD